MSFSGLFLKKNANKLVPAAYATMLLAKFPSFITMITSEKGKLIVDGQPNPSMDDFVALQEVIKANDALIYMGKYPNESPEDSYQPFILEGDQDNPIIVTCLEGDFNNYAEAKSAHSPEFFAFTKYLRPKVKKWTKNGGDYKAVIEELNDSSTKTDLRNSFQGRGAIAFMFPKGDIIMVQNKNPEFKEYDWGWTTNSLGYVEKKTDTTAPVVEEEATQKKKGWFSTSFRKDKGVKEALPVGNETFSKTPRPAESQVQDTDGSQHAKQEEAEETVAEVSTEASGNVVLISWKPAIVTGMTRQRKQDMYDEAYGVALWRKQSGKHYPESYKNGAHLTMEVPAEELSNYVMNGWFLTNGMMVKTTETKPAAAPKDVATKHIPEAKRESAGFVAFKDHKPKETLAKHAEDKPVRAPLASIDAAKASIAEMHKKKILDFSSVELPFDPAKIQSLEHEHEATWKRLGLDGPEDIFRFSREGLRILANASFETFLDLFEDTRLLALKGLPISERPASPRPAASTEPSVKKQGKNPFKMGKRVA